jgi:hypothetical protein
MELVAVKLARGSVTGAVGYNHISANLNAMMTVSFRILHISVLKNKNCSKPGSFQN